MQRVSFTPSRCGVLLTLGRLCCCCGRAEREKEEEEEEWEQIEKSSSPPSEEEVSELVYSGWDWHVAPWRVSEKVMLPERPSSCGNLADDFFSRPYCRSPMTEIAKGSDEGVDSGLEESDSGLEFPSGSEERELSPEPSGSSVSLQAEMARREFLMMERMARNPPLFHQRPFSGRSESCADLGSEFFAPIGYYRQLSLPDFYEM